MKKWMLGLLLALCLCVSAAYAESSVETVFEVVETEFAELYSNNIKMEFSGQTETGETVKSFLLTNDQYADNTLLRPWIYGWENKSSEVHSADALMNNFYMLNSLVSQVGSAIAQAEDSPVSAQAFTVFNQAEVEPYTDRGIGMQVNGYISDNNGRMELMYVQVVDKQGVALSDEMFVYCRFSVALEENADYVVTLLMTDQESVLQIASTMQEHLPENVLAWYQTHAGEGN